MKTINQFTLLGFLGSNAEYYAFEHPKKGGAVGVLSFPVATSRKSINRDTGEESEFTQWHRCKFFITDEETEFARMLVNLSSGDLVMCQGEIRYMEYTNKQDEKHWATELVVSQISIIPYAKKDAPATKGTKGVKTKAKVRASKLRRDDAA